MTATGPVPEPTLAERAFNATADAFAASPDSWERAVQAGIAELFDFLAGHSAQTAACILADCDTGREALARRDRVIARFVELLRPGLAAPSAAAAPPPPPVVAEAIGGGIYELVRIHVLEGRVAELPDAVSDATVIALSPFMGANGAIALASSPRAPTAR